MRWAFTHVIAGGQLVAWGTLYYTFAVLAPFVANALLLAAATGLCFASKRLRAGPPDLPGRDETPSPETPPASQPGPEGNR